MPTERKKRTIRAYDRKECRRLLETEGVQAAMAKFPEHVVRPIAQMLALWPPPAAGAPSSWKEDWDKELGTKPDSVLAAELDISLQTVRKHRQAKNIAALRKKDWSVEQVLAVSDKDLIDLSEQELVQQYNLPLACIRAERVRRGLATRTNEEGDLMRAAVAGMLSITGRRHGAYAEIGRRLGISRERVRQLVIGLETNPTVPGKKAA